MIFEIKQNSQIKNFIERYLELNTDPDTPKDVEYLQNKSKINIFKGGKSKTLYEIINTNTKKCIECYIARSDGYKCDQDTEHAECNYCEKLFPIREFSEQGYCDICSSPCCGLYFDRCKNMINKLCLWLPPRDIIKEEDFCYNEYETS